MLRWAFAGVTLLLSPLLPACESSAINREARDLRNEALTIERTLVREPSCERGIELGPNCGLLMKRLASEKFRVRFAELHCTRITVAECRTRYIELVSTALEDRYPGADPEVVQRSCRARNENCSEPLGYELVVMDAHNATVSDLTARRELEIESERRRLQAEHGRRVHAAAMTVLFMMYDGPKCSAHAGLGDSTLIFCKN